MFVQYFSSSSSSEVFRDIPWVFNLYVISEYVWNTLVTVRALVTVCYLRSAVVFHAYGLGQYFERSLVWTMNGLELVWKMVWNLSGQGSGTCLIRGYFGLELV